MYRHAHIFLHCYTFILTYTNGGLITKNFIIFIIAAKLVQYGEGNANGLCDYLFQIKC